MTATSRLTTLGLLLLSAGAAAHEAASPEECRSAGAQPPISEARAALGKNPKDLEVRYRLADAWSDLGCFGDAVAALEAAPAEQKADATLMTRLRVARSMIGEEQFFDNLDRADAEARVQRATFRCATLHEASACVAANQAKPGDPQPAAAGADTSPPASPPSKAALKENARPRPVTPRSLPIFSNADPASQSH